MTVGRIVENPERLPKQMTHWFAKLGIREPRVQRNASKRRCFYGSTRNKKFAVGDPLRYFRVLPEYDRIDICDAGMDRWANSLGASISPIPKTEAEFNKAIATLVAKSRLA